MAFVSTFLLYVCLILCIIPMKLGFTPFSLKLDCIVILCLFVCLLLLLLLWFFFLGGGGDPKGDFMFLCMVL